jgi:hypothetical protein
MRRTAASLGRHGDCRRSGVSGSKGGVGMRALVLYMLGVPVFLIVILWLFGVV